MEQKYVMAAIDAALKAGGKILSIYNDPASDFEIERKADNSPLTIADRKAHEAIVDEFQLVRFSARQVEALCDHLRTMVDEVRSFEREIMVMCVQKV